MRCGNWPGPLHACIMLVACTDSHLEVAHFLHWLNKILLSPCSATPWCGLSLCISEWGKGLFPELKKESLSSREGGSCCFKAVYWRAARVPLAGPACCPWNRYGLQATTQNGMAQRQQVWQGSAAWEPQEQSHLCLLKAYNITGRIEWRRQQKLDNRKASFYAISLNRAGQMSMRVLCWNIKALNF